jgi:hypothetical protein
VAANSANRETLSRKPLGRHLLALFLVSTVGFAVVLAAAYALAGALTANQQLTWLRGLRNGALTGPAFAVTVGFLDFWQRRRICSRYGLQCSDYATRQKRAMTLPGALTRVVAQIEAGMRTLPWLYPHTVVRNGNTLTAVTLPSLASFSEDILVSTAAVGQAEVAVTVTSRPRSIGTIVDYGKGIQNVEELKRAIEEWLR